MTNPHIRRAERTNADLPGPLGATWDGQGTRFALYSRHATAVALCLFDERGERECSRIPLARRRGFVWQGHLPDVGPGQRYGFRVDGPYQPELGLRFNYAKLLIDPYARALSGSVDWSGPIFGYHQNDFGDDLTPDAQDDAMSVPKSVVVDERFDWGDDRPPLTPWNETVIYELHVKGMTALHPDVSPPLRGTYSGLCQPAIIDHLTRLGVTAVELLPVQAIVDDQLLVERGLRNYWGYSTIGFFAPEARYASRGDGGQQVNEFKEMVKTFHAAGLEVLLDVVYNHSGEGTHLGPSLCYRGIDNRTYYRLVPHQARYNEDLTGTGNTLNTGHPQVLKLIMDSLRYWVEEMHVDGFRFDLAPVLGRDPVDYDSGASFFDAVQQDPVLSGVKLIAEPWDLGHGGYQLGSFPLGWSEWNDRFRDAVRGIWLGHQTGMANLAVRLAGSADVYSQEGRDTTASINFVTAHDGFTLYDLVSYDVKHNEINGEENRDGSDHNLSSNHGVEGPSDDPDINAIRARQIRNLMATLLLSQGVPMVLAGDEIGRSQRGNNNAYCQDNEISWIDWSDNRVDEELLDFVRHLISIRTDHPAFRQTPFFQGVLRGDASHKDLAWFHPSGREMTVHDWEDGSLRAIGMQFAAPKESRDERPESSSANETFLLLVNADRRGVTFHLPPLGQDPPSRWSVIVDTSAPSSRRARWHGGGRLIRFPDRTLLLCQREDHTPGKRRRPHLRDRSRARQR